MASHTDDPVNVTRCDIYFVGIFFLFVDIDIIFNIIYIYIYGRVHLISVRSLLKVPGGIRRSQEFRNIGFGRDEDFECISRPLSDQLSLAKGSTAWLPDA